MYKSGYRFTDTDLQTHIIQLQIYSYRYIQRSADTNNQACIENDKRCIIMIIYCPTVTN